MWRTTGAWLGRMSRGRGFDLTGFWDIPVCCRPAQGRRNKACMHTTETTRMSFRSTCDHFNCSFNTILGHKSLLHINGISMRNSTAVQFVVSPTLSRFRCALQRARCVRHGDTHVANLRQHRVQNKMPCAQARC